MKTLDVEIGATVHCTDGPCGEVRQLALDAHTGGPRELIVDGDETVFAVPAGAIERLEASDVYLSVSKDAVGRFAPYREQLYNPAPENWAESSGCLPDQLVLAPVATEVVYPRHHPGPVAGVRRYAVEGTTSGEPIEFGRGSEVRSLDGVLGTVDHVLVDQATGRICHVVVDTGPEFQELIVPAELIEPAGENGLLVKAPEGALQQMPRCTCRADDDILAEVQERLRSGAVDTGEMRVEIRRGVVRLSGVVVDVAAKRRAEATARSVKGVVGVHNALDTDTAIMSRVLGALLADPRTELAVVDVAVDRGVVTLSGLVDDVDARGAAREIAANQTGVKRVVNALEVGHDKDTDPLLLRLGASLPPAGQAELGAGLAWWL